MESWVSWGRLLACVLALAATAGCKSLFGTPGPPADPMFLDKEPQVAKAEKARPQPPRFAELVPPRNPGGVRGELAGMHSDVTQSTSAGTTVAPDPDHEPDHNDRP